MKDIYEFRQKAAMHIMERYPELNKHDVEHQLMLLADIPVEIKESEKIAPDAYTGVFSIQDEDGVTDTWHVTFVEPDEWNMLNITTGHCYIDASRTIYRPVVYPDYSNVTRTELRR